MNPLDFMSDMRDELKAHMKSGTRVIVKVSTGDIRDGFVKDVKNNIIKIDTEGYQGVVTVALAHIVDLRTSLS